MQATTARKIYLAHCRGDAGHLKHHQEPRPLKGDDGVVRLWDLFSLQTACDLSREALGSQRRAQYLGGPDAPDMCRDDHGNNR